MENVHIDPRSGEAVSKPAESRQRQLEDLLSQIPEVGSRTLDGDEPPPHVDITNFIPQTTPDGVIAPPPVLESDVTQSSVLDELEATLHINGSESAQNKEALLADLKAQLQTESPADPFNTPDSTNAVTESVQQESAAEIARRKLTEVQVSRADVFVPDKDKTQFSEADELSEKPFVSISPNAPTVQNFHIDDVLKMAVEKKASDIHFTVGLPPMARVDGEIIPLDFQPLRPSDTRRLVYDVVSDENLEKFERTHELDFGYTVKGIARFRFNVYMQRGSVAAAMRYIPNKIPSFESLYLPPVIRELSKRTSGLVLVTGPTGSGKTTTIASMIDDINENMNAHILTIEDPIEYLHRHKRCMVNQREMHSDTLSFHGALRAILREDPDIILVGELRDHETIEAALTLAETGHLVFGTLHTRNAPATIDRIIDVFAADQQDQIRVLLGNTIEAIICQQLLPRQGGGRRAAIEIMTGTAAVKNLIREGKTHQMYSVIETSKNQGMQTMDGSLAELYKTGNCSYEDCVMRSVDKESFARLAKTAA
ncbi:MAG: type IV pilus twitching motility protein PilT [Armatimonadetes bacterium]|nr:type IV pilus twitching motility protein PilT [Armatimonadota bacterium]